VPNPLDTKRRKDLIHIHLLDTQPAGKLEVYFAISSAMEPELEGLGQGSTPPSSPIDVALDCPRLMGGGRPATQSPTEHIIGQRPRTCLPVESSPLRHLKSIPHPTHTPVTFQPPPRRMEPSSCLRVTAESEHQPRS